MRAPTQFIEPVFRIIEGRTPARPRSKDRMGVGGATEGPGTSNNWSGAVVIAPAGSAFFEVDGEWTVPNPQLGFEGVTDCNSSIWVGIDGWLGSADVLQAGVRCDVTTSGQTIYAWWEWFPEGETPISNFPVSIGDDVEFQIFAGSSTLASIYLQNWTAQVAMQFDIAPPAGTTLVGNDAEWIVERPTVNGALTTLANYGAVTFSNASCYSLPAPTSLTSGFGVDMITDSASGQPVSVGTKQSSNSVQCVYKVPFQTVASSIAAVSRLPEQLDLFAMGQDGTLFTTFWNSGGWGQWYPISDPAANPFDPAAVPTVVSRYSSHMDIFMQGTDGIVYTNWYDDGGGFGNWYSIDPRSFSSQKIAVAADIESLHVFMIDGGSNGAVVQNTWTMLTGTWTGWLPVPGASTDPNPYPATSLTALKRQSHIDLLSVNSGGVIFSNGSDDGGASWNGWGAIGFGPFDFMLTSVGAPIGAVSRTPSHLDIFVVSTSDMIMTNYWDDSVQKWGQWYQVSDGIAQQGSFVMPVARMPGHIDLFIVGVLGFIATTWWDDSTQNWAQWRSISDGYALQDKAVVPIARFASHLDLFVVGLNGNVISTWWDDASPGWPPWFFVY
jgi:hypothetical protein